jgi:hypothetical protein
VGWKKEAPYNDRGHPGKGLKDTLYSKSEVWGFREGDGESLKMPIDKLAKAWIECAGAAYSFTRHDARGGCLSEQYGHFDYLGFC